MKVTFSRMIASEARNWLVMSELMPTVPSAAVLAATGPARLT